VTHLLDRTLRMATATHLDTTTTRLTTLGPVHRHIKAWVRLATPLPPHMEASTLLSTGPRALTATRHQGLPTTTVTPAKAPLPAGVPPDSMTRTLGRPTPARRCTTEAGTEQGIRPGQGFPRQCLPAQGGPHPARPIASLVVSSTQTSIRRARWALSVPPAQLLAMAPGLDRPPPRAGLPTP
jgi:hypothetical protein